MSVELLEQDVSQSFREATPLLERLDELLSPMSLQVCIVPKARKVSKLRIAASPSDNGTEVETRTGPGGKKEHHQVRYWRRIKKIATEENVSMEEARKIYKQRKDAA